MQTVEFALSNTSDEWISGWLAADPSAGSFTSPVDHHGYDKVVVRATFVDGTTSQKDADVGTCDTPAEPEHPSMPSQPADSSGSANTVTSLPKTGAGDTQRGLRQLAVITGAVALAGVIATTMRKQHAR